LIICSLLRGLSVRDVEAALEEDLRGAGDRQVDGRQGLRRTRASATAAGASAGSTSTTWSLCCLDALHLKLRPDDEPAEGVLVAWGVTLEGRKVRLGLALGSRESYEIWLAFGAISSTAGSGRRR
jgi:transposase-like protein